MITSTTIPSDDVAAIREALTEPGTVTLFFPRTSRTFTFQLWEPRDSRRRTPPLFVSHVEGNARPRYLGMLTRGRRPAGFKLTKKSPDQNHPPLVAFRWLWEERVSAGRGLGPVTFARWSGEEPEEPTAAERTIAYVQQLAAADAYDHRLDAIEPAPDPVAVVGAAGGGPSWADSAPAPDGERYSREQPRSGLDGRPVAVTDPHPTYVPSGDPDGETVIDF